MESRICNKCGVDKPLVELVASSRYVGGYMPLCKECRNRYWRKRHAENPVAYSRHKEFVKRSKRKGYGLTEVDYEKMLAAQDGKCALCGIGEHGRSERYAYWNIDHDHATGRVRGLLCHDCNIAVGYHEKIVGKVGEDKLMRYLHPDPTMAELYREIMPETLRIAAWNRSTEESFTRAEEGQATLDESRRRDNA